MVVSFSVICHGADVAIGDDFRSASLTASSLLDLLPPDSILKILQKYNSKKNKLCKYDSYSAQLFRHVHGGLFISISAFNKKSCIDSVVRITLGKKFYILDVIGMPREISLVNINR